ncbi:hypothetical protein [Fervidobacterium islandicum]|uniref:hypothetical protein n=1 Tax=Fervidobacterium islandicum TaxID=2423 RepID=UPI003A622839
MTIVSGNALVTSEYDVDIFITTSINGYKFNVPYTFYFDGNKVYIYQYALLKHTIEKKVDVKFDNLVFRILIGNEIGIIENYVKHPPHLFICFERTSYPSKFFYRKSQMWIGAQVSKINVFGHIVYNNTVNRMLFSANVDEGVIFEGTGVVVLDENLIFSNKKEGTYKNRKKQSEQ